MKEILKFIFIVICVFLVIILIDSLYAIVFDKSPFIKVRDDYYIRARCTIY